MTLIATWVRRNKTVRELVVASDSCVSGGERWNSCPKVIVLPRPGAVMAMAGDTVESHPFVLHAVSTCHLLDGHAVGRTDIGHLANQLRRVFDDNRKHVTHLPKRESRPRVLDVELLLGGWSWRRSRFEIYTYRFDDAGVMLFDRHSVEGKLKSSLFLGDAADSARKRLKAINRVNHAEAQRRAGQGQRLPDEASYNWEPLDVLIRSIEDEALTTVGGAPQIARVYQYGLTEQFIWKDGDVEWFGGRPILDTERSDRRVFETTREQHGLGVKIALSERSVARAADAGGGAP